MPDAFLTVGGSDSFFRLLEQLSVFYLFASLLYFGVFSARLVIWLDLFLPLCNFYDFNFFFSGRVDGVFEFALSSLFFVSLSFEFALLSLSLLGAFLLDGMRFFFVSFLLFFLTSSSFSYRFFGFFAS